MFVRWQNYRSIVATDSWKRRRGDIVRIKAVLVESVRIDGKPRQKYVAFLASYDPKHLEWDWLEKTVRSGFWRRSRRRLDQLGNRITPEQRAKIEAELMRRVVPTTPEENAELDARFKAFWGVERHEM